MPTASEERDRGTAAGQPGLLHFRPDTWDRLIFGNVMRGEYGELDLRGRTVVDIGAHIGSFAMLAAAHGARHVLAIEANRENFALLQANCAALPGVECLHGAVWHDEDPATPLIWRPSSNPVNSGGGTVVPCDRICGFDTPLERAEPVSKIPFDRIVADLGAVDLVKIDAEGSEYPILLNSRMLHRVAEIVGEYHVLDRHRTPATQDWNVDRLVRRLQEQGFIVERDIRPDNGIFRAFRPKRATPPSPAEPGASGRRGR